MGGGSQLHCLSGPGTEGYRALVEHGPDAISVLDRRGQIIYASPSTQRVLGYTPEELVGRHALDLVHPQDLPLARATLEQLQRTPGEVLTIEARVLHRSGEWRWIEAAGSNLLDLGAPGAIAVTYRDVGSRKAYEKGLERRAAELEALYQLAEALTRPLDLDDIYGQALDSLRHICCCDTCAIITRDAAGVARFQAWRGLSERYRQSMEERWPWPAGFCDPDPVVVEDIARERWLEPFREAIAAEGVQALACVPLCYSGGVIGGLAMYFARPHRFGETEIRQARVIAAHTEVAYTRHRTEEALRTSAAVVDASSDAIFNKNTGGIITSWNAAAERMYGYTAAQAMGRSVAMLVPAERTGELDDILARLRRGERIEQLETERVCRDGRRIQVQLTISPLVEGAGRVYGSSTSARDITDRKRRESWLLLMQDVAVAANEAASVAEAVARALQQVCAYTGWEIGHAMLKPESAADAAALDLWHPSDPGRFLAFREASAPGRFDPARCLPGRAERSHRVAWTHDVETDAGFNRQAAALACGLRSGLAIPVLAGAQVAGVIEFYSTGPAETDRAFLDTAGSIGVQLGRVVERQRGARALRESESRYRMVTETASDGILTVDQGGGILFANSRTGKIFGYPAAELSGSNVAGLMPAFLEEMRRRNAAPEGDPLEIVGRHRDGREISLEITFTAFRSNGRRAYTGVIRDITERKRMEEQFRQTQKLESLGVLAGGVAHDFNNLLTGIMGNASLALEAAADSAMRGALESVITASQRAADLTRQLLAYAGKGRFVITRVNLSELVREISNLIRASIPKTVELRLDLAERLAAIEGDASQLQQLIMNVIINGAEAIAENEIGTVLITTGVQEVDENYLHSTAHDESEMPTGRYVFLEVHDTGKGMDEETKARIFDPFFTTKFTGRGLGLAAVSGIVRAHSGAVRVYSTPGQGTTFKVLFPALNEEAGTPRAHGERRDLSGTGLILVADDEELVRRTAKASLQRYGYTVLLAEDGQAAVDLFREMPERISLVLLDMTMPVKGGEDTFRELREIRPDLPVMLSSGYSELEAVRRFAGKGLAGFIQKPYTSLQLAEKIKNVLERQPGAA